MKSNICIMPFYNEEKRIIHSLFFDAFSNNSIHFILVNDGSSDSTYEILKYYSDHFDNVNVLNNLHNLGKAESIRKAVIYALDKYETKYIGFFDSDFATPFFEYLRLSEIAVTNKLDIVFASRVKLFGNNISRNIYRHYFSRVIVTIINYLFKIDIYDTQCGCKIYNTNILRLLFLERFKTKWLFDIEIFIRYFKLEKKHLVKEVNINEWKDISGSKIKFIDFISTPIDIFKIWFYY